jgi:hypothetical protein
VTVPKPVGSGTFRGGLHRFSESVLCKLHSKDLFGTRLKKVGKKPIATGLVQGVQQRRQEYGGGEWTMARLENCTALLPSSGRRSGCGSGDGGKGWVAILNSRHLGFRFLPRRPRDRSLTIRDQKWQAVTEYTPRSDRNADSALMLIQHCDASEVVVPQSRTVRLGSNSMTHRAVEPDAPSSVPGGCFGRFQGL